jgi:hypothetical protein
MKTNSSSKAQVIDVARLAALLAGGSTHGDTALVDVRHRHEYRMGHIPGATNLPLNKLGREAARRLRDKAPDAWLRWGMKGDVPSCCTMAPIDAIMRSRLRVTSHPVSVQKLNRAEITRFHVGCQPMENDGPRS